jgi:hypothetical protein
MGSGVSTARVMPWSADSRRKDTSVNASKDDGRDRKNNFGKNFQVDLQTCSASWSRRNRSPRRLYRSIIQLPCALLRHSSARYDATARVDAACAPAPLPLRILALHTTVHCALALPRIFCDNDERPRIRRKCQSCDTDCCRHPGRRSLRNSNSRAYSRQPKTGPQMRKRSSKTASMKKI